MADEQSNGIDMNALATLIDQRFQAHTQQFIESQRAENQRIEQERQQQEQQRQQLELARQQAEQDTFGTMVRQSVQPLASNLGFQAQETRDYVDFYLGNPQAAKYKDQVEAKFAEIVRSGRQPIPRSDILRWLVGTETLQRNEQEAAQTAAQSSVMGGGQGHQTNVTPRDPYSMTPDELEAALAGREF